MQTRGTPCRSFRWRLSCSCRGMSLKVTDSRRSGVCPTAHATCRGRHKSITPVRCAQAARVLLGMRGGTRVRRVGNRLSSASRPRPDADECSVPEVVRMSNVPQDQHVAVTSLRDGGAGGQGSVVVYQTSCSTTVW